MAKITKSRRRSKGTPKSKAPRRLRLGHLLAIECDAPTLATQGLAIGSELVRTLKPLFPKKAIEVLSTSANHQLANDFASISEKHDRFNTILLIGHSNSEGIQLAAGTFVSWPTLAMWLAPFEPKNILLIACSGARFEGAKALFERLASLRDVYGSPIELTKQQTASLVVLTTMLLSGKRVSKDMNSILHAGNFLLTKGVSYRWSRNEVLRGERIEGVVWNQFAEILKGIHQ